VAESDGVEVVLLDGALKEMAAEIASLLFDLGGGRGGVFDRDWQAECGGEGADEGFIGIGGGAAEVVVDVEDVEVTGEVAAELMEEVEENDGIGARGDGDADGLGGLDEHAVTRDEGGDLGGKVGGRQ
jgi:hypothetical protein